MSAGMKRAVAAVAFLLMAIASVALDMNPGVYIVGLILVQVL